MPLGPEDVVRKNFNTARFRGGYAAEEVDGFLEEVVAELRRLTGLVDQQQAEIQNLRAATSDSAGHQLAVAQDQLDQVRRERDAVVAELTAADRKVDQAREAAARAEEAKNQSLEEIRERFDEDLLALEKRVAHAQATADAAEQDCAQRVAAAEERARSAEAQAELLRQKLSEVSAGVRAAAEEQLGAEAVADLIPYATGLERDPIAQASAAAALAERIRRDHLAAGEREAQRLIGEAALERDAILAAAREQRDRLQSDGQQEHDRLIAEGRIQLDLARSESEGLVAGAQAEADQAREAARQQSEQLLASAQQQHDDVLDRARTAHEEQRRVAEQEAARLVSEAQTERDAVLADLATRREALESRIAQIDSSARAYRQRMRALVQEQLVQIDGEGWEL